MRVQIWLRDDLTRHADNRPPQYRLVTSWNDKESTNHEDAAQRAWLVCSRAPHTLTLEEQQWRQGFDAVALGYGLSVGDIVVAGRTALKCEPQGWSYTDVPTSPLAGE